MCFILKLSIFCFCCFFSFLPLQGANILLTDNGYVKLGERNTQGLQLPSASTDWIWMASFADLFFFSFFFSWPLCCSSFTLYLFLYILPFHYIPLILFPFIHFFLSFLFFSSSLFLSWLWRISPDHSDPSKEEVIHWNTLLVSCLYLTKSFTDVA